MKTSDLAIEKIKEFEGLRLTAYQDAVGVWTVGYGTTGKDVYRGVKITKEYAEELLRRDLKKLEDYFNHKTKWINTQGKFDACIDFCYNLGLGRFVGSTLYRYIRQGKPTVAIQAQFKRWCYAGKKKLAGLERRRAWEAERWAQ